MKFVYSSSVIFTQIYVFTRSIMLVTKMLSSYIMKTLKNTILL